MSDKSILVVGALEQDVYLSQVTGLSLVAENNVFYNKIKVGDNLLCHEKQAFLGGSGGNVGLAFSKWGLNTIVFSPLGSDGAAWEIRQQLDANNINTSLIQTNSKIATGINYRLYDRGTTKQSVISYETSWTEVDLNKSLLLDPDFEWGYVASAQGNFAFYDVLFRELKAANRRILFNPGEAEIANISKFMGLVEDIDILLVNRHEAELITGDKTLDGAVKKLTNLVVLAVITGAEDGVIVSDGQSIWRAGVYQKVTQIDRTGVGDAFGAGFLAKYCQTGDVAQAIIFGSANASSVIGKIGGTTGLIEFNSVLDNIQVRESSIL